MRRLLSIFVIVLTLSIVGCPPAPKDVTDKKDDVKVLIQPPPKLDSFEHLRTRVKAAIEQVHARELYTTNAFWTVFHGILGMGLEKATLKDLKTGTKVNAIDYICDGGEVRGLQFLPTPHGLDVMTANMQSLEGVAQGHQDQFIAEMAQWGMPSTRKFKVAGKDFTFDDFIRHSTMRASVTKNQELSWAIIIISQFHGTDYAWTNSHGEKLRFEDVVRYEINAPTDPAACGGTHRLFGFTWAYHLHTKKGGAKTGVWADTAAKIEEYKELAKKYQSRVDGSLSTEYFKGPGKNPDPQVRISTTGHIVEWLALALTDEELREPWMQDAVNALVQMMLEMKAEPIESGALYHAVHGLQLYYDRVFGTPAPYLPLPPRGK